MEAFINVNARELPSPQQLAYIGDAVWELHVRRTVLAQGAATMDVVHRRAVARVQAAEQAVLWRRIEDKLTDEELKIARRARNAKLSPPRGTSHTDYRHGTSFEGVLGFLYWTGRHDRLQEVMQLADEATEA